jgi:hypothetical protein
MAQTITHSPMNVLFCLLYVVGYCIVETDINAVCSRINGEAELHTIVRGK